MASAKLNDPARRDEWVRHVEAWRPTGQSMRGYCRDHHLSVGIFRRWVLALENTDSVEAAARHALKRRKKSRGIRLNRSTRNRAAQAFWAMHVEALTWSGMSLRSYAAALNLSEDALGSWRLLIEAGTVDKDWRALLPAARPALSTSANDSAKADQGLTGAAEVHSRRSFTPTEKAAIVRETQRRGATVSAVARRHHIVPSVIFRWRAEMGLAARKPADLALVTGTRGGWPSTVHARWSSSRLNTRTVPSANRYRPASASRAAGLNSIFFRPLCSGLCGFNRWKPTSVVSAAAEFDNTTTPERDAGSYPTQLLNPGCPPALQMIV
ncbi:MAG: IS66 family insertion sequence hypothetical protein [Alphaproteobacteria bacterium]|nr:MAG: IS66 family insertion sequence hypothetical protein [Alphaproteobacteria bacterium]